MPRKGALVDDPAEFDVSEVPSGPEAEFMRLAVLTPLVGPVEGDEQVIEGALEVARMWRARVEDLASAGFTRFAGRSKRARAARERARNCRPAFVAVGPGVRACGLCDFCPSCWARGAAACWRSIDRAFRLGHDGLALRQTLRWARGAHAGLPMHLGGAGAAGAWRVEEARERAARSPGDDLIEWTKVADAPLRTRHVPTGMVDETLPRIIHEATRRLRPRWLLARPCPSGMLESIGPSVEGDRWRVELRRLIMVPAGSAIPEAWAPHLDRGKVTTHPKPDRATVMGAVARACAYPADLLRSRDLGLISGLIEAQLGSRVRVALADFRAR